MELGGFSAHVAIEENKVESYNVEVSADKKTATCWIVSETGKNFSVHWKDSMPSRATTGRLTIDGMACRSSVIYATNVGKQRNTFLNGIRLSRASKRPFVFSAMELTDDDTYLDNSLAKNIGDIILKIWRASLTRKEHAGTVTQWQPPDLKVHERSKKAFVHQVGFGVERPAKLKTTDITAVLLDKEPLATFIFKYRSLDILQANGIIPAPEPARSQQKRKADNTEVVPAKRVKREMKATTSTNAQPDPDSEEVQLLEERLSALREEEIRHLEERLKTLRAKRAGSSKSELRDLKLEQKDVKPFASGDVIDLT